MRGASIASKGWAGEQFRRPPEKGDAIPQGSRCGIANHRTPRCADGDSALDCSRLSTLMFSKIAGRDSLVGAAWAYFASVSDTVPPPLFAGSPPPRGTSTKIWGRVGKRS